MPTSVILSHDYIITGPQLDVPNPSYSVLPATCAATYQVSLTRVSTIPVGIHDYTVSFLHMGTNDLTKAAIYDFEWVATVDSGFTTSTGNPLVSTEPFTVTFYDCNKPPITMTPPPSNAISYFIDPTIANIDTFALDFYSVNWGPCP